MSMTLSSPGIQATLATDPLRTTLTFLGWTTGAGSLHFGASEPSPVPNCGWGKPGPGMSVGVGVGVTSGSHAGRSTLHSSLSRNWVSLLVQTLFWGGPTHLTQFSTSTWHSSSLSPCLSSQVTVLTLVRIPAE